MITDNGKCKFQDLSVAQIIDKVMKSYEKKALSKEEATEYVLARTPAELLIMLGLLP